MGWIRSVDRQALHRPHGSLAVHLKYKKNLPDAGFCLRLSICSDFAGSDRGVQLPFGGVTSPLVLRFWRLFVGRIFVSIFPFCFLWSSAKYLPGGNASDLFFFGFSCQKVFWRGFPVVSGQEFLASGRFFLACFTHPVFGPGLALLGVVLPIPFLGRFRLFWVWSLGFFVFFPPVATVCQDFLVSFSWFPIMVFLCTNTCVVHVPAAILSHKKPRVMSFLEEVVDLNKLSAVQFIPRGLIRLTFKELADKERLVSQGSIMLEMLNVT